MNKPNDIYNILNTIKGLESKDQAPAVQPNLLKTLNESNTPLAKTIRALNEKYAASKKVKESGKPDFLDLDNDGNKEEKMKDAAADADKVDEAGDFIKGVKRFIKGKDNPSDVRDRHLAKAAFSDDPAVKDKESKRFDKVQGVLDKTQGVMESDQEGIEDLMAAIDEELTMPGRHIDNLVDVMNATFDADTSREYKRAREMIGRYIELVTNTDVDHYDDDDDDRSNPAIGKMTHGNIARHIREYDLGDYLAAAYNTLYKLNDRMTENSLDVPFDADPERKAPSALAGKYGIGPSTAKHLAKQGMKSAMSKKSEYKETVPTTHEDPLVTVYDKDGIHTHANLSVVNRIFNINVDAEDVHAGPVIMRSGWEDRRKIKIEISDHHDERVKKDMDEELLKSKDDDDVVPGKSWVRDPSDPESKIPAYRRKERDAGDSAARRAIDKLNKDAGADVWRSTRSSKMLEAGLDMNLFKGAQGAMAGANIDPESERNRNKPYGYRTDRDDTGNDDDYDEFGNEKKGAKRLAPAGDAPKKRGRPRKNFGPERTTAKAYKHKGKRINLETFVEDAMAELDSLVVMEKLTAKDPAGEWISDFVHSDDPKFKGKSKEERKKQALGAYYAAKRDAKQVKESHDLNELARLAGLLEDEDEAKCNHTKEGKECPVHGLKECGSMMEGVMSEIDMDLQDIAQSEDEDKLIDAMEGLHGTGVQIALEDMMDNLMDELAAKGMNDVMRDHDKMIELLMDKLVREYKDQGDMDEGNEFSGELAKARASGAEEFEVDGKTYKVNEDLQADDGEHYDRADDFFSQFEADHFDREEESDDGMEVRGYIDGVNVMVWRFDDESKTSGYGVYNDDALNDLNECGMGPDMPEEKSGMNINSSLDTRTGNKTLSVTAQGEAAEQLARILKMAGVAGSGPQEAEGMERPMEEYANEPDEKVAPVDAAIPSGDDLHRKKKQYADRPKLGDNPMATEGTNEIAEQLRRMYTRFGK